MSKRNSGVYRIEIGDRYYYGMSVNIRKREQMHIWRLRVGRHQNQYMQSAYDKHGEFSMRPVVFCEGDYMSRLEADLIRWHIDDSRCMNLAIEAGDGVKQHSEETKRKIGDAHRGKDVSKETRQKLADAIRNKTPEEIAEWKSRIAESKKGQRHTQESREKMRQSHLGRRNSDESYRKSGEARRGRGLSEQHKQKIRKPIAIVTPNGEFYFPSLTVASQYTGMAITSLSLRLSGQLAWPSHKRSEHAGWTGHYIDKEADSGN